MTYNANLQANNVDLQSILNTINTLPEAGGGASNIAYGTFTIDSKVNTNTLVFEHGLGCVPDLVVVVALTRQSTVTNKGNVMMVVDTINMRRHNASATNEISTAILEEAEVADWVNETTFSMHYAYWTYGVGDHVWFAVKRGA